LLLSFTGLTKVLVTTGWDEGSNKMEIIDLSDPANVCQPSVLDEYPIDQVQGASGGLLSNDIALICGGSKESSPTTRLDDCFVINENVVEATIKLTQPRSNAASVVLNGNTSWMTGGVLDENVKTKSTEFVELNATRPGPDLPVEVSFHCLVPLNDTTVLLIGGYQQGGPRSKDTFFYNIDHQTWTEGPKLLSGRSDHSCALFKSPQHGHTDTVIVTGGLNGNGQYQASTEFLNSDSKSWTSGTDLFIMQSQH
jgi:hypothetical protein